jgi:hypothetical protein
MFSFFDKLRIYDFCGHAKYWLIKSVKLRGSSFLFLLPLLVEAAVAETKKLVTKTEFLKN